MPGSIAPATIAPVIMTDDAEGLIGFLSAVFGAVESPQARTQDADGLVLHAELFLGDGLVTVTDRKPHWPYTPAFMRIRVDDVETTVARAVELGARVVTEQTTVRGHAFARVADPFGHLWSIAQRAPALAMWDEPDDGPSWTDGADLTWQGFAAPELAYVQASLLQAMDNLVDPRLVTR